jgi:hypothetical protein
MTLDSGVGCCVIQVSVLFYFICGLFNVAFSVAQN